MPSGSYRVYLSYFLYPGGSSSLTAMTLLNPVVIIVLVALMGDTEKRRLEKIREAEEIRLSVRAEYDKKNQERGM